MKLIIMVVVSLILLGCTNQNNSSELDISCETASDCKQACPVGCINIKEYYKEPLNLACEQIICECLNNTCHPFG